MPDEVRNVRVKPATSAVPLCETGVRDVWFQRSKALPPTNRVLEQVQTRQKVPWPRPFYSMFSGRDALLRVRVFFAKKFGLRGSAARSEEHTSELQSLTQLVSP